jgi:hypothetical protein
LRSSISVPEDRDIEGFVFNSEHPYSTSINIPSRNRSVMNFSFVDYYDLLNIPNPPDENGKFYLLFYGSGNDLSNQPINLRYFVSFDKIEFR